MIGKSNEIEDRLSLWQLLAIGGLLALFIDAITVTPVMATAASPKYGAAWDDLRFPPGQLAIPIRAPDFAQFRDDGAGSQGVYALQFGDEAVLEEQVFFTAQMPHRWREGSEIEIHVHVTPEDATACNYRMCAEYVIGNTDTAFGATTTTICATFASDGDTTVAQYEDIGDIAMTGYEISTIVHIRVYRNSADAADTCNGKYLWLHEADIHYQVDRPGSRSELTK
jgi:hypothetical protein